LNDAGPATTVWAVENSQRRSDFSVEKLSLDAGTLEDVAAVSTAAFVDDPFFKFLSPKETLRRRGLKIYCRGMVASLGDRGHVLGARAADGRLLGTAAFVRPGNFPLPPSAQVRQASAALWALLPRPPALISGSRYLLAMDRAHPRGELWYLALLVVDPSVQRGGIGSALQEPVYGAADKEGLPSYLETQKAENLAYYRRFGYEVVKELRPVRRGPPLWTMRREPRPPAD
jgi:GNAT superfamily N-acetyltransferase